jgi:hypothetical protein
MDTSLADHAVVRSSRQEARPVCKARRQAGQMDTPLADHAVVRSSRREPRPVRKARRQAGQMDMPLAARREKNASPFARRVGKLAGTPPRSKPAHSHTGRLEGLG